MKTVLSETSIVKGSLGCTRDDTQREPRFPKLLALIFIVSFLCAGCNQQVNSPAAAPVAPVGNYSHQLQIGAQTLNVEIASTPAEQQQGLSGRKTMADNQGMLFEFDPPQMPAFWMKDMDFNLDFIWIAGGKVVGITSDVPAPVNCQSSIVNCKLPLYYPPSAVDEVLEINAGWGQKNKIKTGDEVRLGN